MRDMHIMKISWCILFVLLVSLWCSNPVLANQTKDIIKEATWDIGGGESYEGARARAKAKAERDAAEEAGVYIESYSRSNNLQLTADEVQLIAASVLKVEVLDEEQRKTGKTATAAWIKIKATVSAASIEELRVKLKNNNTNEQLRHALLEADKLKKLLDEQNQQLTVLRQQLSQAQDEASRQKTLAAVASNDRTTQALEALREARRYAVFLNYPEAEKALERTLNFKPDLAEAYLTRGDVYLGKKEYMQAAASYRQATQYASGMKEAWFGLAVSLTGQGLYKEAAQAFSYSVEYHPEALSGSPAKLEPYEENGRWGFRRADGVPATPAKFDYIEKFYDGLAQVTFGDQVGYVTATQDGALLLAVNKRCKPWDFSSGLARVKLGDRYGYMDKSGHLVVEPRFKDGFAFQDEGASVKINGKWGLINHNGQVIIEPQYDQPLNFSEGLSAVPLDRKFGYVNAIGRLVIPALFEYAGRFQDGLSAVMMDGKWGYIDHSGQFVISPRYAEAESFHDGKAKVALSSGFGYIDSTGKIVIPPRYYIASRFEGGIALVHPDTKSDPYWINCNGDPVPFKEGKRSSTASQDLVPFEINGAYGYKDGQNQVIIPAVYEYAHRFHDGLAAVKLQNKWGYIDTKGQLVIANKYIYADDFSEGLAVVSPKEDQYIFIDRQGQQAIAAQFDWADNFYEGLATVGRNNPDGTRKYGFINRSGQLVIPYQFNMVSGGFSEGLAAVLITQEVWIDKNGQIIKQEQ